MGSKVSLRVCAKLNVLHNQTNFALRNQQTLNGIVAILFEAVIVVSSLSVSLDPQIIREILDCLKIEDGGATKHGSTRQDGRVMG